ncbi:MAG: protein-glutamate O-methyltransferase CheR [Bdellovibrionales bacterium]
MRLEDFDLLAGIVKQRTGLVLTNDKAYLLESRLPSLVRKYSLKTVDDLAQAARIRREEHMLDEIAEAMASTETRFFRDYRIFDHFRKAILPQLIAARGARKQLRVWSTGTSTGQEAYSLAMIFAEEAAALAGWKIEILATDVSAASIERAKSGIYTQFEAQRSMPIRMLIKYFHPAGDNKWQINAPLRQSVQFRTANLLHDFGPVGTFDVIFCRNVLGACDPPTKTRILAALASVLAVDGTLVLGKTETISEPRFISQPAAPGIYVLGGPAHSRQAS